MKSQFKFPQSHIQLSNFNNKIIFLEIFPVSLIMDYHIKKDITSRLAPSQANKISHGRISKRVWSGQFCFMLLFFLISRALFWNNKEVYWAPGTSNPIFGILNICVQRTPLKLCVLYHIMLFSPWNLLLEALNKSL